MRYDRRDVRTANVSIDKSPKADVNPSSRQMIKTLNLKLDLGRKRSPRSEIPSASSFTTPSYSSSLKPNRIADFDPKNYYSTVKFAFREDASVEERKPSPGPLNISELDKSPTTRISSYIK